MIYKSAIAITLLFVFLITRVVALCDDMVANYVCKVVVG